MQIAPILKTVDQAGNLLQTEKETAVDVAEIIK